MKARRRATGRLPLAGERAWARKLGKPRLNPTFKTKDLLLVVTPGKLLKSFLSKSQILPLYGGI